MLPHRAIELGGRMWVAHRQKDNFRERLTTSLSGMDILPPRLVSESGRMGGWDRAAQRLRSSRTRPSKLRM